MYSKRNKLLRKIMCVVIITQGGGVAAPVGGQILSEVLPYLEAKKDNTEQVENVEQIQVPNVEGMNFKDAKKTLQDLELEPVIEE